MVSLDCSPLIVGSFYGPTTCQRQQFAPTSEAHGSGAGSDVPLQSKSLSVYSQRRDCQLAALSSSWHIVRDQPKPQRNPIAASSMKPMKDYSSYLSGERFENDLTFALKVEAKDRQYRGRIVRLTEILAGKRVVHLGFLDHEIGLIDKKISRGKWLHAELMRVCSRVAGVDILEAEIAEVGQKFNIDDLHCANVETQSLAFLADDKWDAVLLGELIEHVPNPIAFMTAVRKNLTAFGDIDVIVTTPNGLVGQKFRDAARGRESINSDHKCVYTPYTLTRTLAAAGLRVTDIETCRAGIVKPWNVPANLYYSAFPLRRSGLIATARPMQR